MTDSKEEKKLKELKEASARRWKRHFRRGVIVFACIFALFIVLALFLQSGMFEDWLKQYLVREISEVTGRDVQIGEIDIDVWSMSIGMNTFEIGAAPGQQKPFMRIKKAYFSFHFWSIFNRKLKFDNAWFDTPELYLLIDKNGMVNLPISLKENKDDKEPLFKLIIDKLSLKEGVLVFNNQVLPATGNISDFKTEIRHDEKNNSYIGKVNFEHGNAKVAGFSGLHAKLESNFIFLPNRIIFPKISFDISGIKVEGAGVVYNFDDPKYNFDYKGTWDLKLLSQVFKLPVRLDGKGTLYGLIKSGDKGIMADGELSIKESPIGPFHAENIRSHFLFTPDLIQFTEIRAHMFDGEINGSFVLNTEKDKADYFLQVNGINVETNDIIRSLGFSGLGLFSRNSFESHFSWIQDDPSSVDGKLDLKMVSNQDIQNSFKTYVLENDNPCGFRPVNDNPILYKPISLEGEISFNIKDGDWNLKTSDISLPLTRFVFIANGKQFNEAVSEIKVESHEIRELDIFILRLVRVLSGWDPSIRKWREGKLPPPFVGLSGAANFRGRFTYSKDTPFVIYGNANGKRIKAHNTYFGEGGAKFEFKDNHLTFSNGWSKKDNSESNFSGEIHLFEDTPPDVLSLAIDAKLKDYPSEDILDLFFYPRDLSGMTTGDFNLRIDHNDRLNGGLKAKIKNGVLFKDSFEESDVDLKFDNSWLDFPRILITKGDQKADLRLKINLNQSAYEVSGNLENVVLEELKSLYLDRSPVKGILDLNINGRGFLYKPSFEITGNIENMTFLGKSLGTTDINMSGEQGKINISGVFGEDSTYFNINGFMNSDYTFTASSEVSELNLYKLMPYTGGIVDRVLSGSASGKAQLSGDFRNIGHIHVDGELDDLRLTINDYDLYLAKKFEFQIQDFIVNIPKAKMTDGEGYLEFSGNIGLSRRFPSNLALKYDLRLDDLMLIFEDLKLSGSIAGDAYFRGFVLDPFWGGKAKIVDGYLDYPNLPAPFENMHGTLDFTQNTVSLESFNGNMGGGDINTAGQLTFKNSKPDRLLCRIDGEQIQFNYPAGVESMFNGSLTVSGNWHSKTVSGNVNVSRMRYTSRFEPEEVFTRGLKSSGQGIVQRQTEFFNNMDLNINVTADDNLVIDNNFAKAELSANFVLIGTFRNPVFLGRIEALNGQIFYRDRTFTLEAASIDNLDRKKINPVIDFRARTKVKSYNIFLSAHGTMDKIYPSISSEPSLPTLDVINLLALGKPRESIYDRSEETLLGVGLGSFVSKSLVGGIERGASELFGFDRFRIDPFLVGSKSNPTARLTVGKRITKDLSIIYSTNISETQEEVLIIEYRLTKRTLVVASRDEYGTYGVEIQFESKF